MAAGTCRADLSGVPGTGSPPPYDIRQRVFDFACAILAAYPRMQAVDRASAHVWLQLVKSATSTGAHLEEAHASGTRPQFLSLGRGALREMREARYWLRLIVATRLAGCTEASRHLDEANQLTAILTAIVKKTAAHSDK